MSYDTIRKKLKAGETIILDGGTGTDIQSRGVPMSGDTWCADCNASHPDVVRVVHEDYIKAGAKIITANTFATSALSFNAYGRDDDILKLDAIAVAQAKQASQVHDVCVAGSVSTMRPVIRGSDRSDLSKNWSEAEAKALFARKIDNLKSCGVDMLMLEMMRDKDYSLWACEIAMNSGLPVWINISVERGNGGVLTGFGREDAIYADFVPALSALKPEAMTIMHTAPNDVGEAVTTLKKHWAGPIGVYPESGYFKSPDWSFEGVISPEALVEFAHHWRKQGVTILGGCCGIGPQHIQTLSKEFAS